MFLRVFISLLLIFSAVVPVSAELVRKINSTPIGIPVIVSEIAPSYLDSLNIEITYKSHKGNWYDLDSIASWGKFPRFCINVYRWGDRTFNSYNPNYVTGTGHKFNVKFRTDSWIDYYSFYLSNDTRIKMVSNPSTSMGLALSYLAVTVGYDVNISKLFHEKENVRKKFDFSFCCSKFAVDLYYSSNDAGTKITRFGPKKDSRHLDIQFKGIDNKSYGIDAYYFINNKKYSQAAAFNFSKIQKKSAGTFYGGLSISLQDVHFDFNELSDDLKTFLPEDWPSYNYYLKSNNYTFVLGYGYNWVMAKRWLMGVSVAPAIGFRYGYINDSSDSRYGFLLNGKAKLSIVYNRKNWFVGVIGKANLGIISDKKHTFINSLMSLDASVGFRFNLW